MQQNALANTWEWAYYKNISQHRKILPLQKYKYFQPGIVVQEAEPSSCGSGTSYGVCLSSAYSTSDPAPSSHAWGSNPRCCKGFSLLPMWENLNEFLVAGFGLIQFRPLGKEPMEEDVSSFILLHLSPHL